MKQMIKYLISVLLIILGVCVYSPVFALVDAPSKVQIEVDGKVVSVYSITRIEDTSELNVMISRPQSDVATYPYCWNNTGSDANLDQSSLSVINDNNPAVLTLYGLDFANSDFNDPWYFHVKAMDLQMETSDEIVLGPFYFDNTGPVSILTLAEKNGQYPETNSADSSTVLFSINSSQDLYKIYLSNIPVRPREALVTVTGNFIDFPFELSEFETNPEDGIATVYAWFEDNLGNITIDTLELTINSGKRIDPDSNQDLQMGDTLSFEVIGTGPEEYFNWSAINALTGLDTSAVEFDGESGNVKTATIRGQAGDNSVTVKAVSTIDSAVYTSGVITIVQPDSPPGQVTLSSPSGTLNHNNPSFSWNRDTFATWYQLKIEDAGDDIILSRWYPVADICSGDTCTAVPGLELEDDTYDYRVMSWNDLGQVWSEYERFTILTQNVLPVKPALVSPSGDTVSQTPPFLWHLDQGTTWYQLFIWDQAKVKIHDKWYKTVNVCSDESCSVLLDTSFENGTFQWWIRGWNVTGYGPWSNGVSFTAPGTGSLPGKPSLTGPSGSTETRTPEFSWNQDSASTWYRLLIWDDSNATVQDKWYTASQVCSQGVCSLVIDPALNNGNYHWWIRGWNNMGNGPWSSGLTLTIENFQSRPAKAILIEPSGTISVLSPTFSWNHAPASTWYRLFIWDSSETIVHGAWYTAASSCQDGSCAVTLDVPLNADNYRWWILSWNDAGEVWSSAMNFAVTE